MRTVRASPRTGYCLCQLDPEGWTAPLIIGTGRRCCFAHTVCSQDVLTRRAHTRRTQNSTLNASPS
eukprot:scaffold18007_cov65-Phaeocystis_antarctica.AAC.5